MEQEYKPTDDGRTEYAACVFALVLSAVLSVIGAALAIADCLRGGDNALSYAALPLTGVPCMLAMLFALAYLRRRLHKKLSPRSAPDDADGKTERDIA